MVNGAGLAMATMDMITLYGGEPANFLNIGGSSNPEKIVEAMKLLISDKHVNTILTDIPIVIRLTGTNEAEGREILKGTHFNVATSMADAGHKAVEISNAR